MPFNTPESASNPSSDRRPTTLPFGTVTDYLIEKVTEITTSQPDNNYDIEVSYKGTKETTKHRVFIEGGVSEKTGKAYEAFPDSQFKNLLKHTGNVDFLSTAPKTWSADKHLTTALKGKEVQVRVKRDYNGYTKVQFYAAGAAE